ncbi:pantoate kinase [Saccharolobus islandicus]|uniref:Pantoate kinase n=1 Tax=Saccharolobus islandicus (strain HVE10/4) TaxID=930943 RepID=F0NJ53_SACI0|nr:pantoate kinase [Sulfolobus islandicus]ADX81567.1 GHMP kinase [Sulfolobus islandicus HVE10/4]
MEIKVPVSISGIWYPVIDTENLFESGSIGLTLTLEPYITAEIRGGSGIEFNGIEIKLPNYDILKKKLGEYRLSVYSEVPLGYGYGLSGAISLAYALGVKELAPISEKDAVNVAHLSDVIAGNGLGDVIAQYYGGGLVYRKKAGGLGYGEVEIINMDWSQYPIFSQPISHLPTKSIIKRSEIALKLIDEFLKNPSPLKFIEVAQKFTSSLGFNSEYPYSYRKKGIIVKIFDPEYGVWIKHKIASRGAYVT